MGWSLIFLQIPCRFDMPSCDQIEQPGIGDAIKHSARIAALRIIHEFGTHKRRIAQHIGCGRE